MKKEEAVFLILILIVSLITVVIARTSSSSQGLNLELWDDTDEAEPLHYSICTTYCDKKDKSINDSNNYFYANFTNSTSILNQNYANCTIRFNENGTWTTWQNMIYNTTNQSWRYNKSFSHKGLLNSSVNCTNNSVAIIVYDAISITNTPPYILNKLGYIDFNLDGTKDMLRCNEDTFCYYNFSSNVSDDDLNDVLTYGYYPSSNTTLTNFTINSTTGLLEINITTDSNTGLKKIELTVRDTESPIISAFLDVNITAVNDAPYFTNLANQSFNITETFSRTFNVADEETNTPYILNLSFLSCQTIHWSDRNNTNCTLFSQSNYTFNSATGVFNITFIPQKNDVGNYTLNLTITDNGTNPVNASKSQLLLLRVLNKNSPPSITYICNNERTAIEDSEFTCWINTTDVDETQYINFSSNFTWFKFNNSANSITISSNISTGYNASAQVKFTPNDSIVGNWSVNISVIDNSTSPGVLTKMNSSVINFYIVNKNDSVNLEFRNNFTAYQNYTYQIRVNATDEDLLMRQTNIYDENLTFSVKNISGEDLSWINTIYLAEQGNMSSIALNFTVNSTLAGKNYTLNISVTDANLNSSDSQLFTIFMIANTAPQWNTGLNLSYNLSEDEFFYLNLSDYASDTNENNLTFNYTLNGNFSCFSINSTTGIINFSANDSNIGFHRVNVSISDGFAISDIKILNFTINNTNDAPEIQSSIGTNIPNSTFLLNTAHASEGNFTKFIINISDDDFLIPDSQKQFYNESITVNVTIINSTGSNVNLLNFTSLYLAGSISGFRNMSSYSAEFTPEKINVGNYSVTINASDLNNQSSLFSFNLTIHESNHPPVLDSIQNQTSSILEQLYVDIDATDLEDINDSYGNFTYSIRNMTINGNFLVINSTMGIINFTLNSTYAGTWEFNVSVNDSQNLVSSKIFKLTVYNYPEMNYPNKSFSFNLEENLSYNFVFKANHSVQDNLNYSLYINGILRNSTTGWGNNSNFTWAFTPNFTDETTCSGPISFILNVSNQKLSNSSSWNISINHSNYPLSFIQNIGGAAQKIVGYSPYALNLSDFFQDFDASDKCHNQTIGFTYSMFNSSLSSVQVSETNWTNSINPSLIFTFSGAGLANFSITAYEFNETNSSHFLNNATSNNFSLDLVVPTAPSTPGGGGGGGGGASISNVTKFISLKLITPQEVIIHKENSVQIPLQIKNNGFIDLEDIDISGAVLFNNMMTEDVKVYLPFSHIDTLKIGESVNLTLDIYTNNKVGRYKATVYANVSSPELFDWADFFLELMEANETETQEILLFTDQLVSGNPECMELNEVLEEAKDLFDHGNFEEAFNKAQEAINACNEAITHEQVKYADKFFKDKFYYASIATLIIFVFGLLAYVFKRIRFKKLERENYI
ncbi:MAG: hypothetical protein ACOYT4_05140 [Nanoarchaeota archaeon]